MILTQTPVFNASGNDRLEDRKIIGGSTTGIADLNDVKFTWAPPLYRTMMNNHWIPEKVDLTPDKQTRRRMSSAEEEANQYVTSFLIVLDSMQTTALPHLGGYISAPEVKACYDLQLFQERVHTQAYQYGLQTFYNFTERERIYNLWREDTLLLERNLFIAKNYQAFIDSPSVDNFNTMLYADYVMEGIFFYIGFRFFNTLASRGIQVEWNKNITYIERDENTHCNLIIQTIKEIGMTSSDQDKLVNIIKDGIAQELNWNSHKIGNNILGISDVQNEEYLKFMGNKRARAVGLKNIYPNATKNPYAHLEVEVKGNFFETTITEYNQSASGFEDF